MSGVRGWNIENRLEALSTCAPFSDWPAAVLAELAAIARVEHHARGAEIFASDPERREAFVIAAGEVEISRVSRAGRKYVLSVSGTRNLLALVRLIDRRPIHFTYRAYSDATLLHLPIDRLIAILDAEPMLWRSVALFMCARQGDSLRLLNDQQLGSLEQRMAATIVDLARIHGIESGGGTELGLRLPQEQLGAMLGITRQSVNRLLRGFEEAGLIATDYNRLTIRDHPSLDRIAASRD